MKRTQAYRMLAVVIGLAVVLTALSSVNTVWGQGTGLQQTSTPTSRFNVKFLAPNADILPTVARDAIKQVVNTWAETPPENNTFYLIDLNWHTNWAIATLTLADMETSRSSSTDSYIGLSNLITLLLVNTKSGWQVALDTSDNLTQLLTLVPQNELSIQARQAIFPPPVQLRQFRMSMATQEYDNYKFPWASGEDWRLTNGWHDSYTWGGLFPANTSLDFDISGPEGSNSDILAASPGIVTYRCTTNVDDQALVYITTDSTNGEKLGYLHLSKASLRVSSGQHINQGDIIGRMTSMDDGHGGGTTPPSGSCAAQVSMRTHLHIYFPTKPFAMDGVVFGDNSLPWNTPLYSSQNNSGGGTCPTSGGVIFYKHWQYDCGGEGEGRGYVRRDTTGWQNVGNDFDNQASSVRVPSSWSVKLYEHPDRGGGWVCRNGDDDNFWGDQFNNGVGLNDNVSSFEIFNDSQCGEVANRPPNTPSPKSQNGESTVSYVSRDGRAPTLCWNNNGDPDGNSVEFYAEVYNSAVNDNSGWQGNTCWRPASLDGRYYNYQWHVKARDSQGAESDWSATWHFSIEEPNAPPTITFNTANGNPNSRIDSRDRNWTFLGTANDPEGRLARIEFRCAGDNCGSQAGHTDGNNWSHTQNNMAGRNDIYFTAYDDRQSADSRHLELNIDTAAPVTTFSFNDDAKPNRWPAWFTTPVQVRLRAVDGNTGSARSGVKEIRYRLDGGAWQTGAGDTVIFTVNSDGPHTVEYYAVDKVGNQEGTRSVGFNLDQTPPAPPSGVGETHGVVSDVWQNAYDTPTFTWAASGDAASGLWGYQFYFGPDPNGVAYHSIAATATRQHTPLSGGTRTGTYYLRGRAGDNAGNWSAWTTLFTFRYDGAPPENPAQVTHTQPITSDTWQRLTNQADFTWPVPHDEGSGIKGYYVYWGGNLDGRSTDFITTNGYQSAAPLCGANQACTGYLRLRSLDNVDNPAEDWTTAFILRYDNAPPTAGFTFSSGVTQTAQTLVTLVITATDQGSGPREMRLSNDGQNWASWEIFATERVWAIPGISRQTWPVYLQVRDGVGLESAVVSHTIYLDVNPAQPRSANFRLFDRMMSAGAGAYTSTIYTGRGTLGQVVNSAGITSANYIVFGGYEAGSQAIPIVDPGHDEFTFINGVFAPGSGAVALTSTLYLMQGTLGEVGLPNNETTLTSAGYQHRPGFLAAAPSPSQPIPMPTPTPGPTPTPTPPPPCEFPQISINSGDLFTNGDQVTLTICAPNAEEMMLSNDGGFGGAQWEPYAESKAWTITTYGQTVLPRFVYAVFKDAAGAVHGVYMDDIIYDPTPPDGSVSVGSSVPPETALRSAATRGEVVSEHPVIIGSQKYIRRVGNVILARPLALVSAQAGGNVDLYLNAMDDNSGVTGMQISVSSQFTDTIWESFSALKPWAPAGGDGLKTVYVRLQDDAGNVSAPISATFYLDTLPPIGGIFIADRVAGPDSITATVYLGAEDNLTGVSDMRLSLLPTFTDAVWIPYTTTLTWPISFTNQISESLYVQYRDLAGNVSEVYSDTYLIDTTPPIVYVEVAAGDTLTRTVTILAYDGLAGTSAGVKTMYLSNDPLMINNVVTLFYTPTVEWTFDERRVIWAQAEDRVGNISEPYPAFADYALVQAGFTAAPLAGQFPLTVVFTDTSSGDIDTWQWNFGDGITGTTQSPSHTYTLSGTFTVSLTVGGPGGTDALVKADYIRVGDKPLVANFTAAPTGGDAPLIVQFTDASAGNITARQWDFGDGMTGTLQNPTYVYDAAGVYSVSLTVSGPDGTDRLVKPGYISVTEVTPPPVAAFTAAPLAGQPPLTVVFTDTSTGDITSWQWNFGDGQTSATRSPTHTYPLSGTYAVSLAVGGPGGSDTTVKTDYIQVSTEPLIASFTAGPTAGEAPLAVRFTDASVGNITARQWGFGDGGSSAAQNPVYTYTTAGVYTVSLTVSGFAGTASLVDSLVRPGYITVSEASLPPKANFVAQPTGGEAPLTVQFTDVSSGSIDTWYWNFGDGGSSTAQNPVYTYTTTGLYSVVLIVSGPAGTDWLAKSDYITATQPSPPSFKVYLPLILKD